MTLEEFLNQPLKTNGECEIIYVRDEWFDRPRKLKMLSKQVIVKQRRNRYVY